MKIHAITAILLGSALGFAGTVWAQSEGDFAPENTPVTINGIEAVCDGTGIDSRDAHARTYPMHIEFVGKDGQYLGDERITLTGNGVNMSIHCKGPWALMKLPSGTYQLSMDVLEGGHRDMTVKSPGHVIIRFPNAGGAEDRVASNQ
jgi:hypothetical protein